MEKFLIAGLGNIGIEYQHTRHNIGFEVADAFAARHKGIFIIERLAQVAYIQLKGRSVICIKPTTYMNGSGKAVAYWLKKEHISVENSLTVIDDLALPLEKVRIRPGGSDAGHNGLKDIQFTLETTAYPRLRFGIGNQFPKGGQIDFVLGKWTAKEWVLVQQKIDACVTLIEQFIFIGIDKTMNEANRISFI